MDRRGFLSSGLLVTAGSTLASPVVPWSLTSDQPHLSPLLFIFDTGCAISSQQAQVMAARGIETAQVADNLTHLWTSLLQPRWRNQPMTIAGITNRSDLFVLETLAADYRMRLLDSQVLDLDSEVPMLKWLIVPRAAV